MEPDILCGIEMESYFHIRVPLGARQIHQRFRPGKNSSINSGRRPHNYIVRSMDLPGTTWSLLPYIPILTEFLAYYQGQGLLQVVFGQYAMDTIMVLTVRQFCTITQSINCSRIW